MAGSLELKKNESDSEDSQENEETRNSVEVQETTGDQENTEAQETCTMEGMMRPPSTLSFDGNLKENWTKWRRNFEYYLKATDLETKSDQRKIAVLLHVAGEEAMEKFDTFGLEDDKKKKLDEVYKAFEDFCKPKVNESVERHLFFSRVQNSGENFSTFLTDLKKLSASCEFADLRDSLIKDRIISGISDSRLKNRLLREENLTLQKCVDICKAAELAEIQISTMKSEENKKIEEISAKNKDYKNKNKEKNFKGRPLQKSKTGSSERGTQPSRDSRKRAQATRDDVTRGRQGQLQASDCTRCGRQHMPRQCPAYGKTCNCCHGFNHFANVCRKREINSVDKNNLNSLVIDTVTNNSNDLKEKREKIHVFEWLENVMVNKKYNIKVKLDSGAHCNVMSSHEFDAIKDKVRLDKPNTILSGYGGSNIKVIGTCELNCKFQNRNESSLGFLIVEGNKNKFPTVIGLPTLLKLNLVKKIEAIVELDENLILKEYKDIFEGIGIIKDFEYDIKLKDGAIGNISTCRKVPIALMNLLKSELEKMEQLAIIERVNEPSDWVNPLVITRKKDGNIRICLDPTELNKSIRRQHHSIPTFDELCAQMPNAKVFSTLDADRGFWQVKLTEKSSEYVTFITPFGRFKFKVMPFGISPATEVFQSCFDSIFGDIEGVIILIDDILVWGSNIQEHDARLKKVLDRARERNVTFNVNKCKFKKNEVKYIGHIFSDKGISVDPEKTKAIVEMSDPKNKEELSTFLGMLAYVGRFVPNLSSANSTLRNLTKKCGMGLGCK